MATRMIEETGEKGDESNIPKVKRTKCIHSELAEVYETEAALSAMENRNGSGSESWDGLHQQLQSSPPEEIPEFLDTVPDGRSWGILHQVAHFGDTLDARLTRHPSMNLLETSEEAVEEDGAAALDTVDLTREKDNENSNDVVELKEKYIDLSQEMDDDDCPPQMTKFETGKSSFPLSIDLTGEESDSDVVDLTHSVFAAALESFGPALESLAESLAMEDWDLQSSLSEEMSEFLDTVPAGRSCGSFHQVAHCGDTLDARLMRHPSMNLELETSEETTQLPSNVDEKKKGPDSLVNAPSSSMKVPVPAAGKMCNICFMDDHEEGTLAVCCDQEHYMCQTCFTGWVESESDFDSNPQNVLLNGGRITCVCKKSEQCESAAYANKLIAMVVTDDLYEKYLRARDFVVGKEAVAGALSKIKGSNAMDAVEQEQIRNMYRTKDGSFSAYMCGQCKFGPIDHGWCSNLQSHHGEKKQGGGHVNNACPKCGWFANNIQSWPEWDGNFQAPGKSDFKQPPVSSLSCQQLRAALKARGASAAGNKASLAARLQALYDQEKTNMN